MDVVALVAERLGELAAQPSPVGRIVVATADGIGYDEVARMQVDRPVATWGPLPDLARWIDPAGSAEVELDTGGHPGLVIGVADPDGPVRADLALVSAAVLTSARVTVAPGAVLGGAPVAAVLRWDRDPADR